MQKNMKKEDKNIMKFEEENLISNESWYIPLDSFLAFMKTLVYSIIPTHEKCSSDIFVNQVASQKSNSSFNF